MPLTTGFKPQDRTSGVTAALVFAGLIGSALATSLAEAPPAGALPGVALNSTALLAVERGLAFFAAWLLVVIVSVQALNGRLPIEISGRGVRYAEAGRTQDHFTETGEVLRSLDAEVRVLRRLVVGEAGTQALNTERVRMESDE